MSAEVVEDVLDVGGVGSLGDGTSEGHSTGSEDSEDSRETHGEDAWEGYLCWEGVEVSGLRKLLR